MIMSLTNKVLCHRIENLEFNFIWDDPRLHQNQLMYYSNDKIRSYLM